MRASLLKKVQKLGEKGRLTAFARSMRTVTSHRPPGKRLRISVSLPSLDIMFDHQTMTSMILRIW